MKLLRTKVSQHPSIDLVKSARVLSASAKAREELRHYETHELKQEDEPGLIEGCSLMHVIEGSLEAYEAIVEVCLQKGMTAVFDIGCAYGHQSALFKHAGISYGGMCEGIRTFYEEPRYSYQVGTYPESLPNLDFAHTQRVVGISSLCLLYPCYLTDGEATKQAQLAGLIRDFKEVILCIPNDAITSLNAVFPIVEIWETDRFSSVVYAAQVAPEAH